MSTSVRLPVLFVSHGGGPWPWLSPKDWGGHDPFASLARYLRELPRTLGARPKAILAVSGHWQERQFTVMTTPSPPMIYDYYGFPDHTYRIRYEAPGAPEFASRARTLLAQAGIEVAEDPMRGFDHGVYAPLAVSFPRAEIPIFQVSILAGYDPEAHLAAGRALSVLRDEGVLIIGSGLSYHNLRGMSGASVTEDSQAFDAWLTAAACAPDPRDRDDLLKRWTEAPCARRAHPEEDHLIPLMVVAGAAGEDVGRKVFSDLTSLSEGYRPFAVSNFQFG